jgi:hypothetical protein
MVRILASVMKGCMTIGGAMGCDFKMCFVQGKNSGGDDRQLLQHVIFDTRAWVVNCSMSNRRTFRRFRFDLERFTVSSFNGSTV